MIYIFDLDGTLIDSIERHYVLMENILRNRGIDIPNNFATEYKNAKTEGRSNIRYLIDKFGLEQNIAEEIQSDWINNIEKEKYLQMDRLFDDSIEYLQKVKKEGNKIVFLTYRSNYKGLISELENFDIIKFCDRLVVVSHKDKDNNKEKEIRKINKEDCVVIGDTEVDYNAAMNTKTKFYALNRGFRNKNFWDRMNVHSYSSLSEIQKNL